MDDTYKTLEKPAEGMFRDRNSRFLAFGFPVETIIEIQEIIGGMKKKYHDARHHCYAYRLGPGNDVFRVNDDGEPSGTAGKPIFGQLSSHDLTNTLVVVVRYFGGTLLGTSGLINAYKSAVRDMLSRASIVTRYIEDSFMVSFPYEKLNTVMKTLKEENLEPFQPVFDAQCNMKLTVRKSLSSIFTGRLSAIPGVIVESLQMKDDYHC
jgi:uncharacterized YigZ family protein